MGPLLITLLGMLLIPLFVGSWRTTLVSLSAQGILLAWVAYRLHPDLDTATDWITLFDLIVVRGIAAPLALYQVMRAQRVPPRNDVIPPNLLSWTLAFGIVMVGFNLADQLVPESGDQQTLIAVAASGVLLGFLILSTQAGPFSQMAGALRIENAIALFELGGRRLDEPIAIELGQVVIVMITVVLYRWHLVHLGSKTVALPAAGPDGPAL